MDKLVGAVEGVIKGRESSYSSVSDLNTELDKLIQYAISNRDDLPVRDDEKAASLLMSQAVTKLGFDADINVGRDLWELVSEDSQAQWLIPPEDEEGMLINLVNVAENMAKSQCYIDFV
jgi:hypothetical protein